MARPFSIVLEKYGAEGIKWYYCYYNSKYITLIVYLFYFSCQGKNLYMQSQLSG
jgi:hypothetical protein